MFAKRIFDLVENKLGSLFFSLFNDKETNENFMVEFIHFVLGTANQIKRIDIQSMSFS